MRIVSVDPGLTIGVALFNPNIDFSEVAQFPDRYAATEWIYERMQGNLDGTTVLVEDYQSAGSMTKEARYTIELLGWFNAYFEVEWGIRPLNPAPQARLSAVRKATDDIGEDQLGPMHRNGRDAISALAHAIAWSRRNVEGS